MMTQQIEESLKFIRSTTDLVPEGLVVLGTGLRDAIGELEEAVTIPYSHIPHFPTPTVPSHTGDLVIGRMGNYPLAVMRGRAHYYEGYSMAEITYPLRVLHALGIRTLLITNAAGALNINFKVGDIVLISDHINLMGDNPLRGIMHEGVGARFPVMTQTYDPALMDYFTSACLKQKILLRSGVYVGVAGPNLETPAELRFLHGIGADLVGMSTVPEAIVATQLGVRILGISVVSNVTLFLPQPPAGESLEEITSAAAKTGRPLARIFKHFFKELEHEAS